MGAVGAGGQSAARDEFCSFSLICLAVERSSELVDSGRVDDGETNSVLFHLSVWPSSASLSRELARAS
jgi:hypothetical protein